MASSVGNARTRAVLWALAGLVLLVGLIDSGSCVIARIQVNEDATSAAQYAVREIADQPVNVETAKVAYTAAVSALPNDRETILTNPRGTAEDFRVGADRSVTMTVTRPAPTLIFKYLPKLKDFTVAKTTYTQQQLGM